jgi:hypothetical protein
MVCLFSMQSVIFSFLIRAFLIAFLLSMSGFVHAEDTVAVSVAISGDGVAAINALNSSALGSSFIPDDNGPDIVVSVVRLSGASNQTAAADTSSAGGVSTVVLVVSIIGGLVLAAFIAFAAYYLIQVRMRTSAETIKPVPLAPSAPSIQPVHVQPPPNHPEVPVHPIPSAPPTVPNSRIILPGPMVPQAYNAMSLLPGGNLGRRGYYNQILQMDSGLAYGSSYS